MREIKFRAFHKPSKKIFNVVMIDFRNKVVFSYEQIIGFSKHPYFDDVSYNLKDCELMQYTGIKDCEGKEIFEGDIVEGYVNVFSTDFAGNDRYGRTLKKGNVYYDLETPSFNVDSDDSISFLNEYENIKILGNIYS